MTSVGSRVESPADSATIAILIPCRNEERHIGGCLDSLLENDFDAARTQILVLDGMSTDRTRAIVADYARRFPRVQLVDNPTGRKSDALNIGIRSTVSDVVMRVDAHAVYPRDYVRRLLVGLYEHGADNIGGVRDTARGSTALARAVATAISHRFAAGNAHWRTGVDRVREVDSVFCGCYRRDVFARVGEFNPALIRAQDREFNERLRAIGGKIILDPSVRCTYFPRTSIGAYRSWIYEGAFWLFLSRRLTSARMLAWRNFVPPAFVLWNLLSLVALIAWPIVGALMLAPIAFYWIVASSLAARVAIRERELAQLPLLTMLFAITHYSYGAGAIAGSLRSIVAPRARLSS